MRSLLTKLGATVALLALLLQVGSGVIHELAGHEPAEVSLSGTMLSHLVFGHDHSDGAVKASPASHHDADEEPCVLCNSFAKKMINHKRAIAYLLVADTVRVTAYQDERVRYPLWLESRGERGPPRA